ncbi:unnamed protein product [Owenia fusiformis]|uniref:Uncharacterized protein n=1 Tax=Owenia fusiformis TaxID=6347 RepID=A0A8J1T8Q8_OWEFU|nr:unnamed protein product [Owenia fusiformis]
MGSLGMESTKTISEISEEILHEFKKQVLQEHRQKLCEVIYPRDHYPCLRGSFVLTNDDEERIQSNCTIKAQASAMLDIIVTKGPGAFDAFCKSLQENRTQIFLLKLLNQSLEEKINHFKGIYLVKPTISTQNHSKSEENNLPVVSKAHHIDGDSLPVPGEDGGPEIPD